MDKYEIMLYPRAYRDIHDIYAYIALEKLSPEIAKEQTDRIWQAIKKLELFPKSHQDRLVGRYAGKEYKQLIIDNYIAIFKVDECGKDEILNLKTEGWHEPVDNPQITMYMQSGGYWPKYASFGLTRKQTRASGVHQGLDLFAMAICLPT